MENDGRTCICPSSTSGNMDLEPPPSANLDNGIPDTTGMSEKGDADMSKRQKFHVTLPTGEQVWLTGNTISEAFSNGLMKFGGGIQVANQEAPTFRRYANEWWKLYKTPKLKPTTLQTYHNLLEKHVFPYFGDMLLNEIDTNSVQRFINERSHMAQSSVRQMRILVHEICSAAVEDGFMTKDPTSSNRLTLPTRRATREALSTEHYLDVLGSLSRLAPQDAVLVALLAYTGMRRGEALGLCWVDVDLESKLIRVERNVTFKGNQPVIGTPKSAAGYRQIPIVEELCPFLQPQRGNSFVVGGGDKPITESTFDRAWQRIGKTIDLHGATPHVLRHTYLTTLEATGTGVKTIQAIAGHANIQTTMNRYVHSRMEGIKAAGAAFSELTTQLTKPKALEVN